jgi:uncharacterized protein YdeI (YjbR/CyaY-like superfamily)
MRPASATRLSRVNDLTVKAFRTQKAWETWLARNYERAPGIWLKLAKKASGIPTVTYDEAVEVALCYGWIDGQAKGFDESYHLQRFTPRRAKSNWSKINRKKAEALIASGRMQPAGLRQVEAAKADGRWGAAG